MASSLIVFERCLFESQAFRGLSGTAKTVYFDFRLKCQLTKLKTPHGRKKEWVITNNGKIQYCYSEAQKRGITRPRFQRAIDELVQKGFIDIHHSGQGGRKGDKSLYGISDRWRAWGTDNFVEKKRTKDTRKGRGWTRYHQEKKGKKLIPSLKIVKGRSGAKKKCNRTEAEKKEMEAQMWLATHEEYAD